VILLNIFILKPSPPHVLSALLTVEPAMHNVHSAMLVVGLYMHVVHLLGHSETTACRTYAMH